jgi:hypothetical protein
LLDSGVFSHHFAGALSIFEQRRVGNLAFEFFEAVAFTLNEGIKIHVRDGRDR